MKPMAMPALCGAGTGPLKINASDLMQAYEDACLAPPQPRQQPPPQPPKPPAPAWAASATWAAPAPAPAPGPQAAGGAHGQWAGPQWGTAPAARGGSVWGDVGNLSPRVSRDLARPGSAAPATEAERRRALALAEQVRHRRCRYGA